MSFPVISSQSSLLQTILRAREQASGLQQQLATGREANSYGGLGAERTTVLSLSQDISQLKGYIRAGNTANLRIEIATVAVTHFREVSNEVRSNSLNPDFTLNQAGQTQFQTQASAQFNDLISLLNTKADGRYIFSGNRVEDKPVLSPDAILNGANGQAGFRQIVSERALSDLGADQRGRLTIIQPAPNQVQLDEDGVHGFGFKISAVNNGLTGVTATGPAGAPASLNLDVGANSLQDGERVAITLDLPDGTSTEVALTAKTSGPVNAGEFVIGATANDTAANIFTALDNEILRQADTDLTSASLNTAADNFFDFNPSTPQQRVDGPPFETATALIDATPTNTLLWYRGELSNNSARDSQTVLVDDNTFVSYGLRANEEAFVNSLKNLAVATVATYSPTDGNAKDRYLALTNRVSNNLANQVGVQNGDNILIDLATSQSITGRVIERHEAQNNLLTSLVEDVVNVDIFEVSAKLLAQQTRLQAAYQTTSILSQLSLVNFI